MRNAILVAVATALSLGQLQAHSCRTLNNDDDQALLSKAEILKNPDVLWAGEGFFNYLLDERNPDAFEDKKKLEELGITWRHTVSPLKDMHDRQNMYPYNSMELDMIHRFMKDAFLKNAEIFADHELKQRLTATQAKKMMQSIDTIITVNPATKEEKLQVVVNEFNPFDVVGYQAKQIVYFDKKSNAFNTVIEAVAPLVNYYDDQGNYMHRAPMFWLKVNTATVAQDLNSADIPWARYAVRHIPFAELKAIKSDKKLEDCLQLFLDNVVKNAGKEDIRNVFGNLDKMPAEEIKTFATSIDTVITFDPVNFTEKMDIVKNTYNAKGIEKMRFLTEWVWDDKKRQMTCYTSFFAPIFRRFNDKGEFLNEGPIFFKAL